MRCPSRVDQRKDRCRQHLNPAADRRCTEAPPGRGTGGPRGRAAEGFITVISSSRPPALARPGSRHSTSSGCATMARVNPCFSSLTAPKSFVKAQTGLPTRPARAGLWRAGWLQVSARDRAATSSLRKTQSLANRVNEIEPEGFDVVIVDEFHHAAAPSYERLLTRLEPEGFARALPPPPSAPMASRCWSGSKAASRRSPDCGMRSIEGTALPVSLLAS